MLLILGLAIALLAIVLAGRAWEGYGATTAPLGWMSEKWLAEHRASHLT